MGALACVVPALAQTDGKSPYKIEFFATPLSSVARQTKHLPIAWIKSGNDVSAEYVAYARPLVGPLPKPGKLF